jgi:hypothetical protein
VTNDEYNKEMTEMRSMAEDICEFVKRCDNKEILEKMLEVINK